MASISLGGLAGKHIATVDDCDVFSVALNNWTAKKRQDGKIVAHRIIYKNRKPIRHIYMHRQIIGAPIGIQVDHKNGNTLDNRRSNLRLATNGQNRANSKPSARSGFKGVYKHWNRWRAGIRHNKKLKWLGVFESPEMAHEAYKKAASKLHGQFCKFHG